MVDPIDEYGVVLDGLLCPEVSGNVSLAGRKGSIHRITDNAKNKFYHEVDWHDFDSDGMKDILTVRVSGSSFTPRTTMRVT